MNDKPMTTPTYSDRLAHPRRCRARRQRDGEPCGCYAIRGATVCRIHGGMAKQVLRKAKARADTATETWPLCGP